MIKKGYQVQCDNCGALSEWIVESEEEPTTRMDYFIDIDVFPNPMLNHRAIKHFCQSQCVKEYLDKNQKI